MPLDVALKRRDRKTMLCAEGVIDNRSKAEFRSRNNNNNMIINSKDADGASNRTQACAGLQGVHLWGSVSTRTRSNEQVSHHSLGTMTVL